MDEKICIMVLLWDLVWDCSIPQTIIKRDNAAEALFVIIKPRAKEAFGMFGSFLLLKIPYTEDVGWF